MFRRLSVAHERKDLTIRLDGQPIPLREGDTLASAVLLSSHPVTRTTPVSGAERAPYCAMGVCFDCLVTVDGRSNQQACLIEARDGMVVTRQDGKANLLSPTDTTQNSRSKA